MMSSSACQTGVGHKETEQLPDEAAQHKYHTTSVINGDAISCQDSTSGSMTGCFLCGILISETTKE
jgi:hypothetical protein